jgi:hypothetical protein
MQYLNAEDISAKIAGLIKAGQIKKGLLQTIAKRPIFRILKFF